ncbi:MAG: polyribonucleotide nucleotidyltransferase [Dehalococcoidia bacterium]|nr:polyribonucleotide nucleotidyltransferase [Dehalococcoidia bacterium]
MVHLYTCDIGGRALTIETGKLAELANGAVTVRYGDTVVLVTVCASKEPREGVDFLPLTVDYEERMYAAGKIPGGFIRREGRPTDEAILVSRMTDRPLRPLFPKTWHNETQVVITVLSADQQNDPDTLAVIGASTALYISDIPFTDPVSAIHLGYVDGQLKVSPTLAEAAAGTLDLVVASTGQTVVMVEGGGKEISDSLLMDAIRRGHEANQAVIALQQQIRAEWGKPKIAIPAPAKNEELEQAVKAAAEGKLEEAVFQKDKAAREEKLDVFEKNLCEQLKGKYDSKQISDALDGLIKKVVRKSVLEKGKRLDGRSFNEIRALNCAVGLLPRTHGSGMFKRGLTQALTITTLGSMSEKQKLDGLGIEETKRFMHHYNFPPFSTGEVKRMAGRSRREIGHGALVERALLPVIPDETVFPYTIRLVSEVVSSSGSSSMASACASTLSLMDAGVPIKAQVAGIAIGLMTDDAGRVAILTDIEGLEDHYGDMDCKVAGTAKGITALQMDTKLKGIDFSVLQRAFKQAEEARLHILDTMQKTIAASREELSPYAPRIYKIKIEPSKIGSVIGPGGKNIRAIIEETKATIDISDDGTVLIGSSDEAAAQKAIRIIEGMTKEIEVGAVYTGKVTRILNFGAMVEILPGKEGLVHISELADYRVPSVEDVAKVGDEIMVKVIEVDRLGRVNLSRKAVFGDGAKAPGAGQNNSTGNGPGTSGPLQRPGPRPYHDRGRPPR